MIPRRGVDAAFSGTVESPSGGGAGAAPQEQNARQPFDF